jgi:hypothetical protein
LGDSVRDGLLKPRKLGRETRRPSFQLGLTRSHARLEVTELTHCLRLRACYRLLEGLECCSGLLVRRDARNTSDGGQQGLDDTHCRAEVNQVARRTNLFEVLPHGRNREAGFTDQNRISKFKPAANVGEYSPEAIRVGVFGWALYIEGI